MKELKAGFTVFEYNNTKVRDMTVFECTLFRQHVIEGTESGFNYFLDIYPRLYLEGDITPEVMEDSSDIAYPFYSKYCDWLMNIMDDKERDHLKRDVFVILNGKHLKNPSKYVPWFTCIFLPLLNNELGIMQREAFEGSRADQPFRASDILSTLNSFYNEWANKKHNEAMKKAKRK